MATNRLFALCLLLGASGAVAREAASPSACQAAAAQPAIANAKAAVQRSPEDLRAHFVLADAWSDAGCFNEALQVLQSASPAHPQDVELKTRLRVARSLIGEEHFFENLDRADADAKLKRDTFRCSTLGDLAACGDAVRQKSDDATLLVAQGDALMRAKRPGDALAPYRRAAELVPDKADLTAKINAAKAEVVAQGGAPAPGSTAAGMPALAGGSSASSSAGRTEELAARAKAPLQVAQANIPQAAQRRYSNLAPESRSH